MVKVGYVLAILNLSQILIAAHETLSDNEILQVYSELPLSEDQASKLGISTVVLPKGEVAVLLEQTVSNELTKGTKVYLAENWRNTKIKRTIRQDSAIWGLSLAERLGMGSRVVEEEVPAELSAKFDTTQSLGVADSKLIRVNDLVGRR